MLYVSRRRLTDEDSAHPSSRKKRKLSIDKHTPKYSSKLTPSTKNLPKVTHAQQKKRKLESKTLRDLETDEAKSQKSSLKNADTETSKSTSSDEDVVNKLKKYKSLDHLTNARRRNVPKISIRKKVSEKLKLPEANSITSLKYKKLLSDVLNNFSATAKNSQNTDGRGKSMSFEAIKFEGNRQISKSSSLGNSKVIAPEEPIGVFNVHKKTYIRTPGPFIRKLNATETFISDDHCYAQSSESLKKRDNVTTKNASKNFSDSQKLPEKRVFDNFNSESETPPAGSAVSDLNLKNHKNVTETSPEKKPVALCQCLHYHTEEGIKKICLQNNTQQSKELGQKFFRVNYFSKQEEVDEDSEGKKELVDKETCTESYVEVKTKRKLSVEKKSSTKERRRKESSEKLKKTEVAQESSSWPLREPSNSLERQSSSKKQETSPQKPKKQLKPGGEKRKVQRKLREVWTGKSEHEASLRELEHLDKLFSKLNSMEKLKLKQKMLNHPKQLPQELKRIKTQGTDGEKSLSSIDAQGRYLRQKRKIRNSIIRQLRNWLQLELDET